MKTPNTKALQEIKGDGFALHKTEQFDAVCVTTNGVLRNNGWAVMGAGVAKACVQNYPNAAELLGQKIRDNGNVAQIIFEYEHGPVISFPTKHHWRDASDLELIKRSCHQLMEIIEVNDLERVLLPRPGCANGGLNWNDVRAAITPILDERVVIISR